MCDDGSDWVASATVAWLVSRFSACSTFEDVKALGKRVAVDVERGFEWTKDSAALDAVRGAWWDAKRRIESECANDKQTDHGPGVVHSVEGVQGDRVASDIDGRAAG